MSDGPYAKWLAAFKPPDVSTPNSKRVCRAHAVRGSYCGRTEQTRSGLADDWAKVVCADCVAGGRADGLELPPIDGRG